MMEKESKYSAFISYATPDADQAADICESLENRGFRCWIAPRNVKAGHEYGEEIIRGIESSRCLVLVLSEAANESVFVRREVERATSKRKPVFPVRIEEVMPSPGLELFISTTHWIDAWSGPLADHAERLAHELSEKSAAGESVPLPRSPLARIRRLPKWITSAAAVLVIAAVVALVNVLTRPESGSGGTPAGVPGGGSAPSVAEVLRQQIEATGVDPASITAEDITVAGVPAVGGTMEIALSYSKQMEALGIHGDVSLAIGDEGPFKRIGSGTTRKIFYGNIDQKALAEEKSIRLRFDLRGGQSIGPFAYSVDPVASRSEAKKSAAADLESWIQPEMNGFRISFSPLSSIFTDLEAIRMGSEAGQLDRRIDVIPKPSEEESRRVDPHAIFGEWSRQSVEIAPDLTEVHLQLEFSDGTRSEERKVTLPPRKVSGMTLRPEKKESGPDPAVHAVFEKNRIYLVPMSPPGTVRVLFSVDHGALNPFQTRYDNVGKDSFPGVGNARILEKADTLQFLFQKGDGSEEGPFSYRLDGVFELPVVAWREKVVSLQREIVSGLRVLDRAQIAPARGSLGGSSAPGGTRVKPRNTRQSRAVAEHLSDSMMTLEKEELFLKSVPAVVLFPLMDPSDSKYWAAVETVEFGVSPEKLENTATVDLMPKEVLLDSYAVRRGFAWHGFLPVSSKEVYCRFVFRDGMTSEPFRVPVEDP